MKIMDLENAFDRENLIPDAINYFKVYPLVRRSNT